MSMTALFFRYSPTLFFIALLGFPLIGKSETLITNTHTIEITNHCEEDKTPCENISYKGISKKSGKALTLKGHTFEEDCEDGNCTFAGYLFSNGNTRYAVTKNGLLTITQNSKVILEKQGIWDYSNSAKEDGVKPIKFPFIYSPDGKVKIKIQHDRDESIFAKLPDGSKQVLMPKPDSDRDIAEYTPEQGKRSRL